MRTPEQYERMREAVPVDPEQQRRMSILLAKCEEVSQRIKSEEQREIERLRAELASVREALRISDAAIEEFRADAREALKVRARLARVEEAAREIIALRTDSETFVTDFLWLCIVLSKVLSTPPTPAKGA